MDKKNQIIEAYKQLVIETHSSKVSVKEICQKANISRPTFYTYFKDRFEIIQEIYEMDCLKRLDAYSLSNLDIQIVTEHWYMNFYLNKDFYCIVVSEDGQNSLIDTIVMHVSEYTKELLKNQIKNKEDLDYISYKLASTQAMILKKWMKEGMKTSPKKLASYVYYECKL